MNGMIFDIQEFAIHDGPGIRLSIFLKGCPLRCSWCHNPEGISPDPQLLICNGTQRISGREYKTRELADIILKQIDILNYTQGGITFTGGEPLMQAAFLMELIKIIKKKVHIILDTSGHGRTDEFSNLAKMVNMVFFGLKIVDPEQHRIFTGATNELILNNLATLKKLGTPFIARIPLVPGVTDSDKNLEGLAKLLMKCKNLLEVNLLPYNRVAGGKYKTCGMTFKPNFDENKPLNLNMSVFQKMGIKTRVI